MKWLGRLMTSGAALLLTAGGATAASMRAPAPADAAWAEAIKSDTLEAYATFAMMYPESKHAPAAYGRLSGSPAGANAKPRSRYVWFAAMAAVNSCITGFVQGSAGAKVSISASVRGSRFRDDVSGE